MRGLCSRVRGVYQRVVSMLSSLPGCMPAMVDPWLRDPLSCDGDGQKLRRPGFLGNGLAVGLKT
jgi:hypothetical protein